MGLESRDYVRDDPRPPDWGGGSDDGTVTVRVLIFTVIVFLAQMFTLYPKPVEVPPGFETLSEAEREYVLANIPRERESFVTKWLEMDVAAVQRGQVWRLLTYAFCHSYDLFHIAFNMFVLWWAGRKIEALYGGREFLLFYLTAALIGSLMYMAMGLTMGTGIGRMLGASGCTIALFALFACHYPRATILILGIIPIEARWLLAIYVLVDMRPVVLGLAHGAVFTGVAHACHLGGLAFGMWYKWADVRIANWFGWVDRWRTAARERSMRRANPDVKLFDPGPTHEEIQERVDELLQKISEHGEASLTDEEREFLKEASKHYR